MAKTQFDHTNFTHNLERALIDRGIRPSALNMDLLVRDLLASVKDTEHMPPRAILRELGRRFTDCLPAYRKNSPFGPRIAAADNVRQHTPKAHDADLLVENRESFSVDDWLDAMDSMTTWASNNIDRSPNKFRIEQALVDLLLEYPAVPIGNRTARALAGRLGLVKLADVLSEDYAAGTNYRYWPENAEDDDAPKLNLAGGPENWNF